MALNSKFAHVKQNEIQDELKYGYFIVVHIHCSNFARFCELNGFEKPNDIEAQNLFNACAVALCKEFPDIIMAYGFGDDYSFIFKKDTDHYSRRASKLVSVIVSLFTSSYRMKWIEFFPHKDMRSSALFEGEVLCLKASTDLQAYLAYKQEECEVKNLKNTCFWKLVESGKSEQEAFEILEEPEKGKGKQARSEILFQQFGINYKNLPEIYRLGCCILRTETEDEEKRKVITVPAKNIASKNFLNGYSCLSEELTDLKQNGYSIGEKHLKKWRVEHQLKQDRWIVIRIDGCSFSRFTAVHEFEKPTDEQALTLMNSCAMAVFEEFPEIVYGYGASDEYSFVLEKNTELHQRRPSKLVSAICSLFTDAYVSKWKEFFPKKELQYAPRFDGRAVCYKSYKLIRDYLSWRQVDCHVNNRHNTCFWALVKSGKSKREAQTRLQGMSTKEKYQMLSQEFGIDYNQLPLKFLNGSSVFWDDKDVNGVKNLVVEYPNIIKDDFWHGHPHIIKNTDSMFTTLEYILFFTAPLTLSLLTRLF